MRTASAIWAVPSINLLQLFWILMSSILQLKILLFCIWSVVNGHWNCALSQSNYYYEVVSQGTIKFDPATIKLRPSFTENVSHNLVRDGVPKIASCLLTKRLQNSIVRIRCLKFVAYWASNNFCIHTTIGSKINYLRFLIWVHRSGGDEY